MIKFSAQKIARKIYKISENPARPAHKNCVHSASVRCATLQNIADRVDRVIIACISEKESVQHRHHANFAPNSCEKIAESPENFGAPRTQKFRKLGQRGCEKRRRSLKLFSELACVLMQDKARVQRQDDATFAQNSREKIAKFPEIRHAPRTKIVCTRPTCAVHTS